MHFQGFALAAFSHPSVQGEEASGSGSVSALSRSHSEFRKSKVPMSVGLALPLSWTRSAKAQELLLCLHKSQRLVQGSCRWRMHRELGRLSWSVGVCERLKLCRMQLRGKEGKGRD